MWETKWIRRSETKVRCLSKPLRRAGKEQRVRRCSLGGPGRARAAYTAVPLKFIVLGTLIAKSITAPIYRCGFRTMSTLYIIIKQNSNLKISKNQKQNWYKWKWLYRVGNITTERISSKWLQSSVIGLWHLYRDIFWGQKELQKGS